MAARRYATSMVRRLLEQPVLVLSAALLLTMLPVRPEVVSAANLEILLLGTAILVPLAIGQSLVLITGGIDLSLPGLMSLASVAGASIMSSAGEATALPGAVPLAMGAMLAIGAAVGLLQGTAVALLKIPPLLASLAMLMILGGLAVWYTQSDRIAVASGFLVLWYGQPLGLPAPVWLSGAVALAAHGLLTRTVFGRRLYAIGHSPTTSIVSGVPVVRTTVAAYTLCGLCGGVAAMLFTARLHTGSPQLVPNEILLDCIGAAVIGGVSLFGGRGAVPGIVLGVLFLTIVGNSLNMLGLRYWHVMMVKGSVILLAALLDSVRARLATTE